MASQGTTPEEKAADQEAFRQWQSSQGDNYIGRSKKNAWWDARNRKYREQRLGSVLEGEADPNKILSGSAKEQEGQLAGLNLAAVATGKGVGELGREVGNVGDVLKARMDQSGADPVSAAIQGDRATAQAQAQRTLISSGAKGAAAAGALDAIDRQNKAKIAASLYGQAGTSTSQYRSYLGNLLSLSLGTMQGEKASALKPIQEPTREGIFSGLGIG